MAGLFTSAEVMARTGITARQLQWWDERGIVVPSREGHRRLYSVDDLAEVAVICELRGRGFSLQRVRKVMRLLQKEFKKRLVDTVSAYSEYHLLTDGNRIYLKDSAEQVIDILKNSRQPMLAVCLSDTVRQIQSELSSAPKQPENAEAQPASTRTGRDVPERRRKAVVGVGARGRRAVM
ncbi:MAG TPA: MerR family transcriptional regulator [Terriglobales bacterium]|nr:MerR family transcriptional regulator [Terriglobales bacterium]